MVRLQIRTVAGLAAIIVLVALAYSNHFHNSFHFDDSHTVVENPYIRDLHNLRLMFTDTKAFSTLPANRTYRPIVTASLALDYALGGGLKPAYFHISTFFWFMVQIVLMYALFRGIFDLVRPDSRNSWTAMFAAAVYGLHPANAETVNYVIQRGDVYSTLGVVAAFVIYVRLPGSRRLGTYLLPLVVAILSKPPAVIFPAILFAYVRLFEEERFVAALKKCVPALLVSGAAAYVVIAMTPPTYTPTELSAYAYRITQPIVMFRYFSSFFWPGHLSADTDFKAVNSVFERGAWLGFIFIAALIAVATLCSRRRQWRPVAFGLWWFLLALLPTSLFVLSEVENDHRMYFAFVGLALAVCWLTAVVAYETPAPGRRAAVAGTVACALLFSSMIWATRRRNEVWRSEESLWHDVTVKSPRNGRGLMNYGLTQMEKGDFRTALDYFERAAQLNPSYVYLEINLGIANGGLNQDAAAEQHFLRAITLAPNAAESHYFYARWLKDRNRVPTAVEELQKTLEVNPDYMPARYLLLQAYSEFGDWPRVRAEAQSILQRFPSDTTAAAYLARANAAPQSLQAASASARTADDYLTLSLNYYRTGRFQDSIKAAQEALKLQPTYAEAYNNIAAAYAELRDWDRAIEAAREAVRLKPGFQLAQNNLAWAESQKKLEEQKRR